MLELTTSCGGRNVAAAREDLAFGLEPEVEIGNATARDRSGQLVRAPGDFQLQVRKIIARNLGDDGWWLEKGHTNRERPTAYAKVPSVHVSVV